MLQPYGGATFRASEGDVTIWFLAPADDPYFGVPEQGTMVNFRVENLDAMLAQLRASGVSVEDRVEVTKHGWFGWAIDPEGNRFELWQPPPGRYPDG
jgi:predicted enzyme related to lactoylglutathione lyase